MKNLVIVESPAKAKTIEKFLGKDYVVESSFGHIRDLVKRDKGIDIESGFIPIYEISQRSKTIVSKLKKLSKQAEKVWLATDEDREGEAIAWHIAEVLKLDDARMHRITFNEITAKAVASAIQSPRKINTGLVNAQQARRVLDRLVGFELSPVLWKKVRGGLSAGRVQSVAVRLIVERSRQRDAFKEQIKWKIEADLHSDAGNINAVWSTQLDDEESVRAIMQHCIQKPLEVVAIENKPSKRSPQSTLTTSLLQQAASQAFGYSVSRTMSLAQRLYEAGHITYMRTDSNFLSNQAMGEIKAYVTKQFGSEYYQPRVYKAKAASAQEAHEAIRPTHMDSSEISGLEPDQAKLYQLIWRRTMMSQMADARLQRTKIKLHWQKISEAQDEGQKDSSSKASQHGDLNEGHFESQGETIEFDGWMKLAKSVKEKLLPKLEKGQSLRLNDLLARQIFSKPPANYTEASLVRKLEELGIGRPSTYAPTISTIQDRGYVINDELSPQKRHFYQLSVVDKQIIKQQCEEEYGGASRCLQATDIAFVVNDFLYDQFPEIMNYDFTAKLELDFDHIASDQLNWQSMISEFYQPFHEQVGQAELVDRKKVNLTRLLGIDPNSGKEVSVKIGRYGPMAQIGSAEDDDKPSFAGLLNSQKIDTITLEEALELFKLPRVVGVADRNLSFSSMDGQEFSLQEGTEIKANRGRFGPYLQYGSKNFVSLKEHDPQTIELTQAMQVIEQKLKADAERLLLMLDDMQVLTGRWGPYVTNGKKNASLGKNCVIDNLTAKELKKILNEKGKPIRKTTRKNSTSKKNKSN